ncbi:MAG: PD40 domain-containing protein [Verrucomicrobiales bacterium]|nr:PD40 domain-containing protein [Verrucomicrobiales bacterium]
MPTPLYENFRDFLASGWYTGEAIRSFAELGGIDRADIPITGTPRGIWHELLARYPGRIHALADEAAKLFPERAPLIVGLVAAYQPLATLAPVAVRWEHNPYVGLRSIKEGEPIFGRGAPVAQLLDKLESTPFLTLYGASGSGKSSILRAGVMPGWRAPAAEPRRAAIRFTPDLDPFGSLYGMGLGNDARARILIEEARAGRRSTLFSDLQRALFPGQRLLIVVDQGEQLIHRRRQGTDDPSLKAFFECLFCPSSPALTITVAMRDDYFADWSERVPAGSHESLFKLRPPSEEELREIILLPARNHGVSFEVGLAEELVRKLSKGKASLPLLQFLLQKLWDQNKPKDGVLHRDAYDALGQVEGALTQHIQSFIEAHPGRKAEITRIFLSLVRFDRSDGQLHAVARPRLREEFNDDIVSQNPRRGCLPLLGWLAAPKVPLCQATNLADLVDELKNVYRLLTDADQSGHITFSHEAVIRAWPDFEKIEALHGEVLGLREDIAESVKRREEDSSKPRKDRELWTDHRLERALEFASMGPHSGLGLPDRFTLAGLPLDLPFREFLTASLQRVEREKEEAKLRGAVITAFAVIAIIAAVTALYYGQKAERAVLEAVHRSWGRARQEFVSGEPHRGMAYLAEAVRYQEELPPAKRLPGLTRAATMHLLYHPRARLPTGEFQPSHTNSIHCVSFSPDGKWAVTTSSDHTAQVWEVATRRAQGDRLKHNGPVHSASFSPDGKWVVTASDDKTAQMWEVATGRAIGPPLSHQEILCDASFSPDGKWIVTASADGTARLWEAATGQERDYFLKHDAGVASVSFSPEGKWIITGCDDGIARVWEVATGKLRPPILSHQQGIRSASFSPDGKWIVTASMDGTAQLWEAATHQYQGKPLEHGDSVTRARFSPDGQRVLTSSPDGTAQVWEVPSARPVGKLLEHKTYITGIGFSPDGKWIVTSSDDGIAQVWETETGLAQGPPLQHERGTTEVGFSPDGKWIVTGDRDGAVRFLEAAVGQATGSAFQLGGFVHGANFSPD